jgi:hypothetical protein
MITCSCVCVMRVQMDVEPGFFEQADAAQVRHPDGMMLMPGGPVWWYVMTAPTRPPHVLSSGPRHAML